MILRHLLLAAMCWCVGGATALAQTPSNTYNWNVVLSGTAAAPVNVTHQVNMTNGLTIVIHNNGTNAFTPDRVTLDAGSFSGSNFLGFNGVASGAIGVGSIAPAGSGTAVITPRLALRVAGTGLRSVKSSVHALTVAGCDDVVYLGFNASGGWTINGTGSLNVANASWSPASCTVHVYRNGPGEDGRAGLAASVPGALDLHIGIGKAGPDGGPMSLQLGGRALNADTAKAASFEYIGLSSGVVELINAGQGRRQFVSPGGLANLEDVKDGSGVYLYTELSLYHAAGVKSGAYYPGVGSPFKTIRFTYSYDSGSEIDSLTLTETEDGHSEDTVYEYDRGTEQWTLVTADGNRREKVTETSGAGTRIATREIRDGSNVLLSKIRETFTELPWGEEITQSVNDPDGIALTATWTYGTTAGIPSYGRLIKIRTEEGYWERYEYDTEGRLTKTVMQYLATADTASESQSRVRTTVYDGRNYTEVENLLGKEISRRHFVVTAASGAEAQRMEQSVTAGAGPGTPDNLVTATTYLDNGTITQMPDGTVSKTTQAALGGGGTRTITETGQPGSGGTVIAGRKNVLDRDSRGNTISDVTRDIATDLVIAEAITTETDEFGRPTEIQYLDGTSESFEYACCGLEQKTDRTGLVTTYQHDAFGNVSLQTTAGISISSEYDALGRLRRQYRIGSDSSQILQGGVDFDLAGQPTALVSASGSTTITTTRDGSGIKTRTETRPGGGTSITKTYPDGHLQEVGGTAEFPRAYEYGVDGANGHFIKEIKIGQGGATTEWTKQFYDLAGRAWKLLYADGASETKHWNDQGQLIREVDADWVTRLYGYNDLGENEDVAIDADGNGQIDYAGADRIVRKRLSYLEANGQTVARQTASSWNETGEITISETDSSLTSLESWQRSFGVENHRENALTGGGNSTATEVSNNGRTVTETFVAGRISSRSITGTGDENAGSETFAYDPHGRLASLTRDGLAPVTYQYNSRDLMTSATQDGNSVSFEYDAQGNRISITRAGAVETEFEYFPTGLLKETSGALTYPVDYTYDPQGRVKTLTTHGVAGAAVTTWNYHPLRGWLVNKRYANNKGPDYAYTPAGRLLRRAWARTGTIGGRLATIYGYTPLGDLDTVSYSDGSPGLDHSYNRQGSLIGVAQGGATYSYTRANDGQITEDAIISGPLAGLGVSFAYDNRRRLEQITVNSGTNTVTMPYTYDGASRLKTAGQGQFLATYLYENGSSRIDRTEFRHGGTLKAYTERDYDVRGRFAAITTRKASDNSVITSHSYVTNDLNQRTRATLQDGSRWDYGYDALGQLTSAGRTWGDNTPVAGQQYGYEFDDIGNRTETTQNGRTAEYTVNLLNQYQQREMPGAIDVMGTATATAVVTVNGGTTQRQGNYFYRALNVSNVGAARFPEIDVAAVVASGTGGPDLEAYKMGRVFLPETPEIFLYDDDGNIVRDGRFIYTWDAENRLVSLESLPSAPIASLRKASYAYDPQGRRVQKKVWRWNPVGGVFEPIENVRFIWMAGNIVGEVGPQGNFLRSHLRGLDLSNTFQKAGGTGGLLSTTSYESSIGQRFPAYDGNGNVTMMININDLSVEARFEYDAFGKEIRATGVAIDQAKMRFSTQYEDLESNFLAFRWRYYNSSGGSWLSRDLIRERGGPNLYSYVFNDPINFIDILGLAPASSQDFTIINSGPLTTKNNSMEEHGRVFMSQSGWVDSMADNCDSYACNSPGERSFQNAIQTLMAEKVGLIKCDDLKKLIGERKIPDVIDPKGNCCPEGYHRIHVRTGANSEGFRDYHLYRQNQDGAWSHLIAEAAYPGGRQPEPIRDDSGNEVSEWKYLKVSTVDASGKPIPKDPTKADHKYQTFNYEEDCGIFCAKTNPALPRP